MRCLTLAEALAERGADVGFVCRAHSGNLIELLQRRGMNVSVLPASHRVEKDAHVYADWLGATEEQDAEQTIGVLGPRYPDWLIVDHYGVGATWERLLRPYTKRLMVIDDLADRFHDCDLLLNQNYSERATDIYRELTIASCKLALGPRYALTRPEYLHFRRIARPRDGSVNRVLVFFGGSDPSNMTGVALEALSAAEFRHLEVDVVVGANNVHREALHKAGAARPRTHVHGPRPHLADLMSEADLAIGAGGGTMWERMCVGVPSLVACLAENQRPTCEALSDKGLIQYLGVAASTQVSDFQNALRHCIDAPDLIVTISINGKLVVDGQGSARLCEFLYATPSSEFSLRAANASDMDLYFDWVNDTEVRRQSLDARPISPVRHQEWFAAKLASSESRLFVLVAKDLPIGQIRFDHDDGEFRIDYSIDALFRGRGLAKHLVMLGLQRMQECGPTIFRAEVKELNLPSRAVFRGLGFSESVSSYDRDLVVFLFDSSIQRAGPQNARND